MSREKKMLRTLQWKQEQAEKKLKEEIKSIKVDDIPENSVIPCLNDEEIFEIGKGK